MGTRPGDLDGSNNCEAYLSTANGWIGIVWRRLEGICNRAQV